MRTLKKQAVILCFLMYSFHAASQNLYNLKDGRNTGNYCEACIQTINQKPKEVLFGIDIHQNGDVYFSITDRVWFEKIFTNANGITVDIISKDRYACNEQPINKELFKGFVFPPVVKSEFNSRIKYVGNNQIQMKIGTLPKQIQGKEVEGNLVILNGNLVCFYSNFVNITRSAWELLPMGLFTDTISNTFSELEVNEENSFTYSKTIQQVVSFQKNKTGYGEAELRPLFDSIANGGYLVRRIEVRAYSSVEGPLDINKKLMNGRGNSIIQALKKNNVQAIATNIITAENWLEFLNDIKNTQHKYLASLTKEEIKKKLTDVKLLQDIEPILRQHRKAVITLYLDKKTDFHSTLNSNLENDFSQAVKAKRINTARQLLKEAVQRIEDNRLPDDYINRLEVPAEKEFIDILSDKEVYKYNLKQTSEFEALEMFRELQNIDKNNRAINYNICVLSLYEWKFGGGNDKEKLLSDIRHLSSEEINEILVKRILINYYILLSEDYYNARNYAAKDETLYEIKELYKEVTLKDEEIYSLCKYFALYSRFDWADELVIPRVGSLDVNEDLLFYFINLSFYQPVRYKTDFFKAALLNAININPERYCNFFKPNHNGGTSFQLLEEELFKQLYCESCSK